MNKFAERVEELRQKVVAHRERGVTLSVRERETPGADLQAAELDGFVESLGFHGIGDLWIEISNEQAYYVARKILHHDLAYSFTIGAEADADLFAGQFLRLFSAAARFFSNGSCALPERQIPHQQGEALWLKSPFYATATRAVSFGGYAPLTKAAFDTGVLVVDKAHVGILWVCDDD